MHHRRGKPKSRRAGCLFCKPWKHQGRKGHGEANRLQERRARIAEREQRAEL